MEKRIYIEYLRWLSSDKVSEEMKKELLSIKNNDEELKLRFSSSLSFGTAGLRGTMCAGINNMNVHTVGRATQGLADYINAHGGGAFAIAYDTRNNSELFARISAEVLAANGNSVYIFDGPRPTPELSFAVRELGCAAGINITASHNPKEYNGYKAYLSDGAQLGVKEAQAVSLYIEKCDVLDGAKRINFEDGVLKGLISIIGDELDEKYLFKVLEERVNKDIIPRESDMEVVYTPLHGAGYKLVPEVLRRSGLKNLITVPEQMIIDGDFPTVKYPNPESKEAFELGKRLAGERGCDLIIATDPDADRMGVMIRDGKEYIGLSGNQVGCLLLDYIITAYKENGGIPSDAYAVKSIVTTELASEICRANGVKIFDVLTGFKFIGEVIKKHEEKGFGTYIFGFEESYGYLKGTYARDKDAVVAVLLVTEMAAYYRAKGMTLKGAVDSLSERYGSYGEAVMNHSVSGADAKEKMNTIMSSLRENPPKMLGGEVVVSVRDYLKGEILNFEIGASEKTGLPSADVLYYTMKSTVVVFRPSGTEPKIKVYFMAKGKSDEDVLAKLSACRADAEKLILR